MRNHSFCRKLLTVSQEQAKEKIGSENIKSCWAYYSKAADTYEFHGPDDFYYVCNHADCLWSAKSEGLDAYLDQL